jgi:hypothetical protein
MSEDGGSSEAVREVRRGEIGEREQVEAYLVTMRIKLDVDEILRIIDIFGERLHPDV